MRGRTIWMPTGSPVDVTPTDRYQAFAGGIQVTAPQRGQSRSESVWSDRLSARGHRVGRRFRLGLGDTREWTGRH